MAETKVVHNREQLRYEVYVDGKLAGFSQYHRTGDRVVFRHTQIDEAFSGQGLGKVLAGEALDDVVANGKVIVPQCPFIAGYIEKTDKYAGHVEAPGR
ncbi:GNAT family N-acetyltransferase [Actinophytocola sp.]|uniref:GNAT family N-acetyltransferase n=1 Tax=Actinophytocola sp. TaxID=1872138 RepID=UPI00389AECD6